MALIGNSSVLWMFPLCHLWGVCVEHGFHKKRSSKSFFIRGGKVSISMINITKFQKILQF